MVDRTARIEMKEYICRLSHMGISQYQNIQSPLWIYIKVLSKNKRGTINWERLADAARNQARIDISQNHDDKMIDVLRRSHEPRTEFVKRVKVGILEPENQESSNEHPYEKKTTSTSLGRRSSSMAEHARSLCSSITTPAIICHYLQCSQSR